MQPVGQTTFGSQLPQYQTGAFQSTKARKEAGPVNISNSNSRKTLLKPTYNIAYRSPATNHRNMSQTNIREDYQTMPVINDKVLRSTQESNSSRIEDSYLRMLKNKNESHTRKV